MRRFIQYLLLALLGLSIGVTPTGLEAQKKTAQSKASVLRHKGAQANPRKDVAQAANTSPRGEAVIGAGPAQAGDLSGNDRRLSDGSYYDAWTYAGRAGESITIDLSSRSFDTYLVVSGPNGATIASNDDYVGTNSRVQIRLPFDGPYRILTNSLDSGATGPYTIQVSSSASRPVNVPPSPTTRPAGRTTSLGSGTRITGSLGRGDSTLRDGSYYDVHVISGRAGEQITITMRSASFDAYLVLADEDGDTVAEDDDGAGGTDSRLTARLPRDGRYEVWANALEPNSAGAYTLDIARQQPRPDISFRTNGDPSDRYAVVVGIDDYPGSGSDLRGPVADAQLVKRMLITTFGFPDANILTLLNSDATRANIINSIRLHLGQAGPNGKAAFFYSGHGTQTEGNVKDQDPEPDGVDEAIVAYDGLVIDDEFAALFRQMESRDVLAIFDSCYSGTATRGQERNAKGVKVDQIRPYITMPVTYMKGTAGNFGTPAQPASHVFLASSSDKELSWTADKLGNSVFTYYLVQVLSKMGPNASFQEAMAEVRRLTQTFVRNTYQANQTPQAEGTRAQDPVNRFLR